jgi:hypothetical protein
MYFIDSECDGWRAGVWDLLVSRSGEDWHIILQNSQASDAAIMITVAAHKAAPALERYVMIALPKQGGNVILRGCRGNNTIHVPFVSEK